jgi:hypothetical protein
MPADKTVGLRDSRSAKRRSAAKKLRLAGDSGACSALRQALLVELQDARTWEAQYQMLMALGDCQCVDALPDLEALLASELEVPRLEPMVHLALGDALLRIRWTAGKVTDGVIAILRSANRDIASGAARAIALQRLRFDEETTKEIISIASHGPAFWIAAAGWSGQP